MPKTEKPAEPQQRAMLQTTLVGVPSELRIYNGKPVAGNGVAINPDDDTLWQLLDDIITELRLRN